MTTITNDTIIEHEKLIYYIIQKYTRYYDKDDLYQAGVTGLIKAYKNYKPTFNTKFSTYAYYDILGEVIKFINNNRNFKVNKDYIKIGKRINEAKNILSQKLMKEPSTYELSIFLEIDESIIINILNANQEMDSLDRTISRDGKELFLQDIIEDEKSSLSIDKIFLEDEISKLPYEEQELIRARYYDDKTQSETANILGINQVQVSRNETKILKKLKSNISQIR